MSNDEKILAIDIGGTRIKYALINQKFEFDNVKTRHYGVTSLKSVLLEIALEVKNIIRGIAISSTGVINTKTKKIDFVTENKLEWKDFDFNFLENATNVPLLVENDANAAAFSEFLKDPTLKKYALIVFGTGVGGGFVFDDKMQNTPLNGEVGFSYLNNQLVDTLLSIKNLHLDLETKYQANLFSDNFFEEHYQKNPLVKERLDGYLKDTACLFYNLVVLYEFEKIFVGGSLSNVDPRFIEIIKDYYEGYRKESPFKTKISLASFKNNSELLGASYKFFKMHSQVISKN